MEALQKLIDNTPEEQQEILSQLVAKVAEFADYQRKTDEVISTLRYQNRLLRQQLYGSSSEKLLDDKSPEQSELEVFDEFSLCAIQVELPEPPASEAVAVTPEKSRPKKKPLPKNLPRKVIEHDLPEEEKQCVCGNHMEYIGADVSEKLDYQRAKVTVIEHHCKKYGCATCNEASKKNPVAKAQMKVATKPPQIIPKGIATPSLLAQIITAKFCDHLPLYRQAQIFNRQGINLSRQTMCDWVLKVSKAVVPLVNLLQEKILEYDVAFADETTLQVLNEPGRKAQTKSYMWSFIGGPPDQRVLIYQYHTGRQGDIAKQFFDGFSGGLHCDGYAGYEKLTKSNEITGVNCWAHCRRKFVEALPNGKEKGISRHAIRTLRKLYQLEESLKTTNATSLQIKQARQKTAKPILDELGKYLAEKQKIVPPKSPVGIAISYTLKRWPQLITYLEDGRYEIDNNRSERAIKPFVMGRKAWLFANSQAGAHTGARLFALIETAKANDLNPWHYLRYIFEKLPLCKTVEHYEALLPWHAASEIEKFSE